MKPPQFDTTLEANYEFWLRNTSWSLMEAAALLTGVDPHALDSDYRRDNNLSAPLPTEYMKQLRVLLDDGLFSYASPRFVEDVLDWAREYNVQVPSRLLEAAISIPALQLKDSVLEAPVASVPEKGVHGNAKRFSSEREEILGAAVSVLVNFFDECKSNGKISGAGIRKVVEEKFHLFWPKREDGQPPMSSSKIEELLNEFIRKAKK